MAKSTVAIITPQLAQSNAGNWHTAARWARFLRSRFDVLLLEKWRGEPADLMVALHARRSADSIAAWAERWPGKPLIVVLTGTDLYRDLATDASAQRSLELATRLVVLNELGMRSLPRHVRGKSCVILQSARTLQPATRPAVRHFDVAVVGHLRDEKDPATVLDAAAHIHNGTFGRSSAIRILHAGRALDPDLAASARAMSDDNPHYRWLGERSRTQTRRLMRDARLLLHPSKMEGGAQAVIEAVTAGTPVIASRIDGNVGLLGRGYPGYFAPGDARACARLLRRAEANPAFYRRLRAACKKRAPLFDPWRERASLLTLVVNELADNPPRSTSSRKPAR